MASAAEQMRGPDPGAEEVVNTVVHKDASLGVRRFFTIPGRDPFDEIDWELRAALRAGDVWVDGSRRYANPETYLIPREQWPARRAEASQARIAVEGPRTLIPNSLSSLLGRI